MTDFLILSNLIMLIFIIALYYRNRTLSTDNEGYRKVISKYIKEGK